MTRVSRALGFVLACLALAAEPSPADLETARGLFKEGRELRAAGRLREALEKLSAAHAVGHTPITGLELARTHVELGELIEARETCLGVARLPVLADESARSTAAREGAAALAEDLRKRIPSITVRLASAGTEGEVRVDGHPLPAALLGEPRKVNPGHHEVVAAAPGRAEARVTLDLREGESREVTLSLPPLLASGPADPRGGRTPPGTPTDPRAERLPLAPPRPEGMIFGASFTLVPHLFLPSSGAPEDTPPFVGALAGISAEVGHEIAPTVELLLRGTAAFGDRATPSYVVGLGPAMSLRVSDRWWVGAALLPGRGRSKFRDRYYETDWVLGANAEVSFAVFTRTHGQWLVSATPGYLFVNTRNDDPLFTLGLSFGYRSF